jgi:phage terminase Nu1 subunit (DNA packaging protein)
MSNHLGMIKSIKALETKYEDGEAGQYLCIEYGKELLTDKKFIERLFNKSETTVDAYIRDGIPLSDYTHNKKKFFVLDKVLSWAINSFEEVTDGNFIKKKKKSNEDNKIDPNDWTGRKLKADAEKTEEQALSERLKRKKLEGELVDKEDIDKSMTEIGAIYIGNYRDDLKLLPVALANKSSDEISEFLDRHYEGRIKDMWKIANTAIKIDNEKIFDKIKEYIDEDKK